MIDILGTLGPSCDDEETLCAAGRQLLLCYTMLMTLELNRA